MKKIALTALLGFAYLTTMAQTERGRWTPGLTIMKLSSEGENAQYRIHDLSLTPSAGYFVIRNLLVGTGIPVSHHSEKFGNDLINFKLSATRIGISPFARYYVSSSKLKPYIGFGFSFARETQKSINSTQNNENTESKLNILSVSPSLGVAYFINKTISIDAQLAHSWNSNRYVSRYPVITDPSFFNFKSQSLTFGIGFNVFFGK